MAMWLLVCSNCNGKFAHAEIAPEQGLFDAFARISTKPAFPIGGLTITCPKCGESSVYQRHQLIYQSA
jgi:hypothetical protein